MRFDIVWMFVSGCVFPFGPAPADWQLQIRALSEQPSSPPVHFLLHGVPKGMPSEALQHSFGPYLGECAFGYRAAVFVSLLERFGV